RALSCGRRGLSDADPKGPAGARSEISAEIFSAEEVIGQFYCCTARAAVIRRCGGLRMRPRRPFSHTLTLSGEIVAIVMKELPRLGRSKCSDETLEGCDAFRRRKRGARPAHVGLDPARIDEDAGDTARGEVDRSAAHCHVHRGFRAAVRN